MKNVRKINLSYFCAFFGDALFTPFVALYLISINLNDFQRGLLLSLIPICTILGNLFYGKLSGKLNKNIKLLKVLSVINSIVIISYGLISNFYILIVLTMLFGLHNSAYFSMQDGIGVSLCEKENKIYSKTRMFGSIGYCVALIFGSYLVEILNYPIIFLIAGIFFFFINVVALFIKTPDEEENKSEEQVAYKELFKNKKFIIYCIFYLLLNGIWVIGESYVSTYFNYLEVKDSTYSLMFGLGVGVEILTIYIFSKLIKKNMNLKLILIFSCLIISGRYLIMGTNISPSILIIITSLLRGIGWGGFLSSHLLLVKKLLGLNLTTKGITFLAIITNLLGSIGNFLIPYIYTNFSFTSVYLFFGFIQIIATIILSRINFNLSKKEEV